MQPITVIHHQHDRTALARHLAEDAAGGIIVGNDFSAVLQLRFATSALSPAQAPW